MRRVRVVHHLHQSVCEQHACSFNIVLAGHEDQNVPFPLRHVDRDGLIHRGFHVILRVGLRKVRVHRKRAAGNAKDRGALEKSAELFRVHCRRRDDELEVRSLTDNALEDAKQNVGVDAPLVGFVHDHGGVFFELRIVQRFPQQNSVRHVLNLCLFAGRVLEPDRVSHVLAQLAADLVSDSFGDGNRGHPPRLRAANQAVAVKALFHQILRQLRGLARARLANDDDDLVVPDHPEELLATLENRQGTTLIEHFPRHI